MALEPSRNFGNFGVRAGFRLQPDLASWRNPVQKKRISTLKFHQFMNRARALGLPARVKAKSVCLHSVGLYGAEVGGITGQGMSDSDLRSSACAAPLELMAHGCPTGDPATATRHGHMECWMIMQALSVQAIAITCVAAIVKITGMRHIVKLLAATTRPNQYDRGWSRMKRKRKAAKKSSLLMDRATTRGYQCTP
eukprot:4728959-Amphidinium_carterae.2